jgi:RNA polymerase sigma-70 factor (ECF subfamily)
VGAIERAYGKGTARWPSVRLDPGEFAAFVKGRDEGTLEQNGHEMFLTCACAHGDRAALEALDRGYLSHVGDYVAKTDPSPAFADEVRQVLRQRLLVSEDGGLPRIREYSGAGPLGAWLRIAATRTALNLRRGKKNQAMESDEATPLKLRNAQPDPELDYLKSRYGTEFRDAFRKVLGSLGPKERSLLSLYYLEGMASGALSKAFKVHPATVRRWLDDVRTQIVAETHALLKDRLDLSSAELKSLMKLLQSQLEQSISRFLR